MVAWTKTLLLAAVAVASASAGAASEDYYDPLRASDRPKMFVDYLDGPLKGKQASEAKRTERPKKSCYFRDFLLPLSFSVKLGAVVIAMTFRAAWGTSPDMAF